MTKPVTKPKPASPKASKPSPKTTHTSLTPRQKFSLWLHSSGGPTVTPTGRTIFNQILIFFTLGCIFGTYWEELLYILKHLLSDGTLVWAARRGLLYGPFSPIYGIGAVAIYLIFYRHRTNPIISFTGGALLGGAIEVGLGFLQEFLFGTRSWNYTGRPFELFHGKTTVPYMLVWGLLVVIFCHLVYPLVDKLYHKISTKKMNLACLVLAIFLAFDIGITLLAITRQAMRRAGDPADNQLETFLDEVYTDERIHQTYGGTEYIRPSRQTTP